MTTIQAKEKLAKVTVLLPEDTVRKIDSMAEKALMGSRGRVVQSMVDSLWDSRDDIQIILNTVQALQSQKQQNQQSTSTALFLLLFPTGNVVRRINQYLGVSPVVTPPQAPVTSQQRQQT